MQTPKVSVLTPIYNTCPQYLRECIESILNQTYTDFEFIILNDSPENTELDAIVKSYRDKRIRYIKNERNIGISASRNKLLEMARGEYLAIFDHDDISLPTRLEKEVAYLDAHPDVGVVSSWLQYFQDKCWLSKSPETDTEIRISLMYNWSVAHTAAMIRKSVLDQNNIRYEEFYTPAEDYRIFTRLMDVTYFYNIQEALVNYRHFISNTSHKQQTQMYNSWLAAHLCVCDKHPELWNEYKKHHSHWTTFRLYLFGIIPILKIKKRRVLLFGLLPVLKISWK